MDSCKEKALSILRAFFSEDSFLIENDSKKKIVYSYDYIHKSYRFFLFIFEKDI